MKKSYVLFSLLLATSQSFAQTQKTNKKSHRNPASASFPASQLGIDFVVPKSDKYSDKIDFAELDHSHPISKEVLQNLTMENIKQLKTEEQLDQLYARLRSGPIPDGAYKGEIIFKKDGGLEGMTKYFTNDKNAVEQFFINKGFQALKNLGELMWNGKHFYKTQKVLRNLIPVGPIQDGVLLSVPFMMFGRSPDLTQLVRTKEYGIDYHEVFPAKLYCGQSLLDSRRESVIIDYAYSKDVEGYQPTLDVLASKDGLAVRDEIRMIRPGFYLGRAYMQRAFGLVFALYNEQVAGAGNPADAKNECWAGTQGN